MNSLHQDYTTMEHRWHMRNVFLVLIIVTASYLSGLMSAAFSKEVTTMHVATFGERASVPQSAQRSLAGFSETTRDEKMEPKEPKIPIFGGKWDQQERADSNSDSVANINEEFVTVKVTFHEVVIDKSNTSEPQNADLSNELKKSENKSNNKDGTKITDVSVNLLKSESVANHSNDVGIQREKSTKNNTDKYSNWRMHKLTDATKIRKKITTAFNVSQDIVLFSDYKQDIVRCYDNGTFQQGCKGRTPIGRYSTCAAVGGSGILIGSACGPEIDAHDFVIRYNMPKLEKYADDVGVKVNLSAMDNYALRFINYSLVVDPKFVRSRYEQYNNSVFFYPKTLYEPKKGKYGLGSYTRLKLFQKDLKKYHVNVTMAYSLRNFKNVSGEFMKRIIPDFDSPTVGLMTYLLALTFCDRLNLYGFYPFMTDPQGNPIHFHYHMDKQPDKFSEGQSPHAFLNEYNFMSVLHKRGVVRATVGKCRSGTRGGANE